MNVRVNYYVIFVLVKLINSQIYSRECITHLQEQIKKSNNMRRSQTIESFQTRQILQSLYAKFIKNNEAISYEDKQILISSLFSKEVETAPIRSTLFIQGESCHKFLYITQGSVTISKRINQKHKIVVASLTPGHMVNIEARMNKFTVKYTAIVQSSQLRYITFTDQQIIRMFPEQLKDVKQLEKDRDSMIKRKIQDSKKNALKQQKDSLVNRLSLPQLKLKKNFFETITDPEMFQKKQTQSLAYNAAVNNIDKLKEKNKDNQQGNSINSNTKRSMIAIIKRNATVQSIQLKKIQKVPALETKRRQQEEKRSGKSLSVRQNQAAERNQKLFKEQLKHIIKRKLLYERKHLTVLKAFRDQDRVVRRQYKEEQQPKQDNKVDDYFIQ